MTYLTLRTVVNSMQFGLVSALLSEVMARNSDSLHSLINSQYLFVLVLTIRQRTLYIAFYVACIF